MKIITETSVKEGINSSIKDEVMELFNELSSSPGTFDAAVLMNKWVFGDEADRHEIESEEFERGIANFSEAKLKKLFKFGENSYTNVLKKHYRTDNI